MSSQDAPQTNHPPEEPATGSVEERDPKTGALKEAYSRLDGKIHGRHTRYVNGQVAQVSHYARGILHGEQIMYRHGLLHSRIPMVQGLIHGEALFYQAGVLMMSLTYAKGLKHGACTLFAMGHPSARMAYEADKLSGDVIALDPQTGQPLAKVPMVQGQAQGQAQYWTPDGYLTRHESFHQGKRAGQAIDYAPAGDILGRRFYQDNRLDGPSVRYHRQGVPAEVRTYKDGALIGVETYSDKGTLTARHGVASGWEEPLAGSAKGASDNSAPWWKKMLRG
jgi:antitoxin component YwqK of YwqJK toxin-antitoxin module